jgi:hypothetical protein
MFAGLDRVACAGRSLEQGFVHVPAGRGPFKSWEEAAIDALVHCAPYAARNMDWSIGRTLTKLEEYNGLGYAARERPSPYIWSGAGQYKSDKYVRDGVYDPNVVDSQPGCAGMLMATMALDPTITFTGATITPSIPAQPNPAGKASAPSITNPGQGFDRRVHCQRLFGDFREELVNVGIRQGLVQALADDLLRACSGSLASSPPG